ncbi:MAG TPA: hypothetical protein VGF49_06160 [Candidatus Solibacter sp.]|jgi:hypothetical protein
MQHYESKETFQSAAMDGVTFVLSKINVKRRLAFNLKMAAKFEALREIYRRRKPFADAYQDALRAAREKARPEIEALMAAEDLTREEATRRCAVKVTFDEEKLDQLVSLTEEAQAYDSRECTPEMVRFFLQSIDGLTIDGEPATPDLLIESGPDALYLEIAAAVSAQMGLSSEEKENLPLAGTSKPPVDGPAIPAPEASLTIAEIAEYAVTT